MSLPKSLSESVARQLRVAVVGAGAFGRNHLRVYRALEKDGTDVALVAVADANADAARALAAEYEIAGFPSVDALLAAVADGQLAIDAASLCVPTVHHTSVALKLMAAGIDVLIEKPIAASLAEAESLLEAAESQGRIVQVGHLERFNPAVTAAIPLLNRPMFFESHRLSVFTPRSLDVDVVLDLMIHDLDVVLRMVDVPVSEVRAVGLPVLSKKIDIANVRLQFENGCVANFTASRVSTERVRKLRFFQPHQYVSLDFARKDLLLIDVTAAASLTEAQLAAVLAQAAASGAGLEHPSAGLSLRKMPTVDGEPLRLELEAFLSAVRTRTAPPVTARHGTDALALALEINRAILEHGKRAGLM